MGRPERPASAIKVGGDLQMKLWQEAMIGLARNERVTGFVQGQPRLEGLALRFVGGTSTESALDTASALHQRGITSSMFFLGEYVTDSDVIARTVDELSKTVRRLASLGLDVAVSVDPTQVGLSIDPTLCTERVRTLAGAIASASPEGKPRHGSDVLMIDMEDAEVTGYTIDLHNQLRAEGYPVGVTVQGYLHRTAEDLANLTTTDCWVRLVKGAFAEPGEVAARRRSEIDSCYRKAAAMMLSPTARAAGFYPAFGTHDDVIIDEIVTLATANGWSPDEYEFELLLGVRPQLQQSLIDRGFRVRLYVPFGEDWFPYAIRRVGESARNLRFAASAIAQRDQSHEVLHHGSGK